MSETHTDTETETDRQRQKHRDRIAEGVGRWAAERERERERERKRETGAIVATWRRQEMVLSQSIKSAKGMHGAGRRGDCNQWMTCKRIRPPAASPRFT